MGQKINPTTFRLKESITKKTKWFLQDNYSDGLHNDIEIREYLSNVLEKKNILLGGTLVKRTKDSTQVYSYIYPLDQSDKRGSFSGTDQLDLKAFEGYKRVLSKICRSPIQLYLLDLRSFSPSRLSNQFSKRDLGLTQNTFMFLDNINNIPKNLKQYQRRPYFQDTLNILETSIISQNVSIFSRYISVQLEKDSRHNLFLDFISKVIKEYVMVYPFLQGIRIQVKGRVNGSERSRKETFQAGNISLQSTSNKLSYSNQAMFTIYGVCGLKVWLCFKNQKYNVKTETNQI